MTKKGYKEIPVDEETYRKLEARAKELGLTVEEYVVKLIREKTRRPPE